jgi:hypothetical protein
VKSKAEKNATRQQSIYQTRRRSKEDSFVAKKNAENQDKLARLSAKKARYSIVQCMVFTFNEDLTNPFNISSSY